MTTAAAAMFWETDCSDAMYDQLRTVLSRVYDVGREAMEIKLTLAAHLREKGYDSRTN